MNEIRTIQKVLVTVNFAEDHMKKLAQAFAPAKMVRLLHSDTAEILKEIEDADAAILGGNISPEMLEKAKKLKWVHCDMAGVNDSAMPQLFERGIFLTASAGRSTQVMAEHAFFLIFSMVYAARETQENQKNHLWKNIYSGRSGLYKKTLGVIGLGNTGCEVIRIGKAFGMRTMGYSRNQPKIAEGFDEVYSSKDPDGLRKVLEESDYVVLAMRLSDETYHMMNEETLSMMKPTAYLINMARGAVVDEKALEKALREETIAGCGSDVFETEPLPAESPLWDLPNLFITPHATPEGPDLVSNSMEIICENIERFRKGEPLKYVLDKSDMYTRNRK